MPFKSDWKKQFAAGYEMVRHSIANSLMLCGEYALRHAKNDGIIKDTSATISVTKKKGGKAFIYKPTSNMNRMSRISKRRKKAENLFHQTKFVDRSGELDKSLDMKAARIEQKNGKPILIFRFTGRAEKVLRFSDSKLSRNKVDITDENGKIIGTQTERGRRRIIQNAFQKTIGAFNKKLNQELDKAARSMKI
jgi:hypothetical protein